MNCAASHVDSELVVYVSAYQYPPTLRLQLVVFSGMPTTNPVEHIACINL